MSVSVEQRNKRYKNKGCCEFKRIFENIHKFTQTLGLTVCFKKASVKTAQMIRGILRKFSSIFDAE